MAHATLSICADITILAGWQGRDEESLLVVFGCFSAAEAIEMAEIHLENEYHYSS